MRETLEKAKLWVEQDEGGYTNEAKDPGGPTKYGIDFRDYHAYIDPKGTAEDVARLTLEEAFKIYEERYWNPCSCNLLPIGIDYFVFDSALLSGVGTAIRWLQRAVGANADGKIGPKTLAAIAKADPLTTLTKIEAYRRARLHTLPQWNVYGRGWTNRVNKSTMRAKKLIQSHANEVLNVTSAYLSPPTAGADRST